MAIYIDKIGHLVTDGEEQELHEFASGIGMKRSWFQSESKYPHYDCFGSKRIKAIENGAVQINARDIVLMLRDGTENENTSD